MDADPALRRSNRARSVVNFSDHRGQLPDVRSCLIVSRATKSGCLENESAADVKRPPQRAIAKNMTENVKKLETEDR